MNRDKLVILLFFIPALLLLGGYYWYSQKKIKAIDSFEECAAAGYPILESYPEQCMTPDGRSFTRALSKSEQRKLDEQSRYEYYGSSTYSGCRNDGDCFVSGCNSEICQSVNEEKILSICILPDRETPGRLGFECKCVEEMCGWGK